MGKKKPITQKYIIIFCKIKINVISKFKVKILSVVLYLILKKCVTYYKVYSILKLIKILRVSYVCYTS